MKDDCKARNQIDEVIHEKEIIIEMVKYESAIEVCNNIKKMIRAKTQGEEAITVHIDILLCRVSGIANYHYY